jgi:hypothetical protein
MKNFPFTPPLVPTALIPEYKLASAAGQDAGNRSMKKHGRDIWGPEDWDAACETFDKIWDAYVANYFGGGQ